MLDSRGFDLWADGYDVSVGLTDEADSYPFAGYKKVLGEIYARVMSGPGREILDIGFGTGNLTAKLYQNGCAVWGQDFSGQMLELAQRKMPKAALFTGDFSRGLVPELCERQYDAVIATYSLHHLTDEGKARLLGELLPLLRPKGRIYIGDVAFPSREALLRCKEESGPEWDDEEIYFVYDELKPRFPRSSFTPCSHCAGVIEIEK